MSRPLDGKSVLITRPEHQSQGLKIALEKLGATVILMPVIDIAPPLDASQLDEALKCLEQYDWLVLTSANGVQALVNRLQALDIPTSVICGRKLAAIGPATATAIEEAFRKPDAIPSEFISEAIADAIHQIFGQRFLLARADLARRDLADRLRELGGTVDEVVAYRIVRRVSEMPEARPDAITLTSAEVARATVELFEDNEREAWLRQSALVCIGPVTAQALRELGYEPTVVASEYDAKGLIDGVLKALQKEITHA